LFFVFPQTTKKGGEIMFIYNFKEMVTNKELEDHQVKNFFGLLSLYEQREGGEAFKLVKKYRPNLAKRIKEEKL
jgi:hypothetical protein